MWRTSFVFALTGLGLLFAAPGRGDERGFHPGELASRLDRLLAQKWRASGVEPAPRADDAEFLRRVYLDLAGRIPRVAEVRAFLTDAAPDKRQRVVERLLDGPQYVAHLSNTWRQVLIPTVNQQIQLFVANSFKTWLEAQFRDNVPYDRLVRDLLTAPVPNAGGRGAILSVPGQTVSPVGFYQANEFKPENLAASATRIFLGVRLECAQCHNHPFAKWTRDQFWETAAFFVAAGQPPARPQPGVAPARLNTRQIKIPNTEKVVSARFLDGTPPKRTDADARTVLADWITAPDNPYFARAGANRLWAHFFGIGLIDPVDDEASDENPPSHPELLAELTRAFVASKFDIKQMVRAITQTQAYQRTSRLTHESQQDARLFARMSLRGLSPEQLFDSLAVATGYAEYAIANPRGIILGAPGTARAEFLNRFPAQERPTDYQLSILQALAMMNGKFVSDATSLNRGAILSAVVDAPFLSQAQQIETVYLAAVGRLPTAAEADRMLAYVTGGGPRQDARLALGDVFWALLNSSEFVVNH